MIEVKTKLRKWGNSLGIVIPLAKAKQEEMKEGEEVLALVNKEKNVLEETFGMLKGKRKQSGQEIKDMIRKELHNIT